MNELRLQFDVKPMADRIIAIQAGLADRQVLHERIVITLQKRIFKQWPKSPKLSMFTMLSRKGQQPLLDKGYLRQSLVGTNPGVISTAEATLNLAQKAVSVIGTNAIYARVQNFGHMVTPTRAKYLALPMSKEARKYKSPRDFKKPPLVLWPLKTKDGYFLVEGEQFTVTRGKNKGATHLRIKRMKKGGPPVFKPHYLLTKSAVIPPRRYFPTAAEVAEDTQKVGQHWLASLYKKGKPPMPGEAA